MALLSPKVIAQVSGRSSGKLGEMSWEWIMRADGQVFYRLTEVNGRRERNPWTLATRLPAAEMQAIRGGKTKATEVLDVIVRQHGHRAETGARGENRLPGRCGRCAPVGRVAAHSARGKAQKRRGTLLRISLGPSGVRFVRNSGAQSDTKMSPGGPIDNFPSVSAPPTPDLPDFKGRK